MSKAASPRRGRTPPPYRVRIVPYPAVVDMEDRLVENAQVLEIQFPGETVETALGPSHVLTGAGIAKIMVGAITIRGVQLC